MIALIITALTVSAILFFTDSKTESTRWAAAIFLLIAISGFATEWEDSIIPMIKRNTVIDSSTEYRLTMVTGVVNAITQCFIPYLFIMFSIAFSNVLLKSKKRVLAGLLLLIAPLASFIFLPLKPNSARTYEESLFYFRVIAIWTLPYVITSYCLVLYSTIKEKIPRIKAHKTLTTLLITPIVLAGILTYLILRPLGMLEAWRYNHLVAILVFLIFMIFAARYGVLGIRLRFEKNRLNSAIHSITSGTMILNHTIKNEILKISMCMTNIQTLSNKPGTNLNDINENINIVKDSTDYLLCMTKRIQAQIEDFVLELNEHLLSDIIDHALQMVLPHIKENKITIEKNYSFNISLQCDYIHIKETIINIIKNSIEAMEQEGKLAIELFKNKKHIILSIRDNGKGIKKQNIPHIIEPFFSTKKNSMNFGLGLSYCFNVMQKHGGSLEVFSEENIGTTIFLSFPYKKVIKTDSNIPEWSAVQWIK